MALWEFYRVESWLSIQQMFVEHLLQAAGRAVGSGGLRSQEMNELGGPCPRATHLVEETDGQTDSN